MSINTQAEAHEQLDYATSNGVNFIDTADLYAVSSKAESYGFTEKHIGLVEKGTLAYTHAPDDRPVPIAETLSVLNDLVKAGKVRSIGLYNEPPRM